MPIVPFTSASRRCWRSRLARDLLRVSSANLPILRRSVEDPPKSLSVASHHIGLKYPQG